MDAMDEKIVRELSRNGRATASDISRRVSLSVPAVAERIRKLDENGVIEQYTVKVNRAKANWKLMAFVSVRIASTEQVENFRTSVVRFPEVLECHHVAGPYDYLLKVLVEDTFALEEFLTNALKKIPGVLSSDTTVVLSTLKEKINRYGEEPL